MATQRVFGRPVGSRANLYLLFGFLALIPVLAFAIGPLSSSSFDVEGPGAHDRRLAHLAADDGRVRGHAPGGGENTL